MLHLAMVLRVLAHSNCRLILIVHPKRLARENPSDAVKNMPAASSLPRFRVSLPSRSSLGVGPGKVLVQEGERSLRRFGKRVLRVASSWPCSSGGFLLSAARGQSNPAFNLDQSSVPRGTYWKGLLMSASQEHTSSHQLC
jgi:hypothetical protein